MAVPPTHLVDLYNFVRNAQRDGSAECRATKLESGTAERVHAALVKDLAANYSKMPMVDRLRITPPESVKEEHLTALKASIHRSLDINQKLVVDGSKSKLPNPFVLRDVKTEALRTLFQAIDEWTSEHQAIKLAIRNAGMQDDQGESFIDLLSDSKVLKLDLSNNLLSDHCLAHIQKLAEGDPPVTLILTGNPLSKDKIQALSTELLFFHIKL